MRGKGYTMNHSAANRSHGLVACVAVVGYVELALMATIVTGYHYGATAGRWVWGGFVSLAVVTAVFVAVAAVIVGPRARTNRRGSQ